MKLKTEIEKIKSAISYYKRLKCGRIHERELPIRLHTGLHGAPDIYKCVLPKCNNFIATLNYKPRFLCANHCNHRGELKTKIKRCYRPRICLP